MVIYKGRIVAFKRINKKHVEINRRLKKEMKLVSNNYLVMIDFWHDNIFQLRDIRHDNLNQFIGACVDPPNIAILTDYCTRGSLKVINGIEFGFLVKIEREKKSINYIVYFLLGCFDEQ